MTSCPKPKDQPAIRHPIIRVLPDGREIVNIRLPSGMREYRERVAGMVVRQSGRCCLEAYAPMCPGALRVAEATFEHEHGRGHGGGKRDDRVSLPDGTWINGAAHPLCNEWKGSRYIDYNRGLRNG